MGCGGGPSGMVILCDFDVSILPMPVTMEKDGQYNIIIWGTLLLYVVCKIEIITNISNIYWN